MSSQNKSLNETPELEKSVKNQLIIILLLFAITLITARFWPFDYISDDAKVNVIWIQHLEENGFPGFEWNFSIYFPGYLYLLWIGTLFENATSLGIIKTIPIVFDILICILIYFILKREMPNKTLYPILGSLIYLLLPLPYLNAAYWGQSDSTYTFFLILACDLLIRDKRFLAVYAFSTALIFKMQAVFLLPALFIFAVKKRFPIYYLALPPLLFLSFFVPRFFVGYSVTSLMDIFKSQFRNSSLNLNAANLYAFFPDHAPSTILILIIAAVVGMITLFLAYLFIKSKGIEKTYQYYLVAAAMCSTVTFLLPKMHERYFFPTEILVFILALLKPEYRWCAFLFQVSGLIAYHQYLHLIFIPPFLSLELGALINLFLTAYLVFQALREFDILPLQSNPQNV